MQPLQDDHDAVLARLAELGDMAAIDSVTRWIRHATLTTHPLISVIVPTFNRPKLLERAIVSVVKQRYETVGADRGRGRRSGDARRVVEAVADPRVHYAEIARRGVAAARNAALRLAVGELVTYVDDDNTMDREWLRAVAWAFEQRPDAPGPVRRVRGR